jgi:hypothetical protein
MIVRRNSPQGYRREEQRFNVHGDEKFRGAPQSALALAGFRKYC